MLIVADVRPDKRRQMTAAEQALFGIDKLNVSRSEIPAVTHVDYSARIQTVHQDTNPLFDRLLRAFKALTGCPAKDAVGQPLDKALTLHEEDSNQPIKDLPARLAAPARAAAAVRTAVLVGRDGASRPVEYWGEPVAGSGIDSGCMGANAMR